MKYRANRRRNATLEEQALARIHRLGQKKDATTVRFFKHDSFEEVQSPVPLPLLKDTY